MPAIHFGNIVKEGNKTILSDVTGIGLDSKQLIDNQLAPKSLKIQEIQDTIDLNVKKLAAYSELKTLLFNVKNINDQFKNDTQNNPLLNNLFDSKSTITRNSDGLPSSTYLEAIAGSKCPIGEYDISITNTATAHRTISDPFSSNSTDVTGVGPGCFSIGTFYINTVPITIATGDTLLNIASKINLTQKTSNVQAYVMQISISDYRLVIQSSETGVANSFVISDPGGVLNNITFSDTAAQDAVIIFNNISLSSPLNTMDNIIAGLTINLRNPTPTNVTTHINIESNGENIDAGFHLLQEYYNNYIDFYTKQTAKKENDPFIFREDAVLGKESLFHLIHDQLLNILISSVINPNEATYINLASVGINAISSNANKNMRSTQDLKFSHKMEIDFPKLNTALSNNFTKVRNIFATNFSSSSSLFGLLTTPPNLTINEFSIDLDLSRTSSPIQASYTQNGNTYTLTPSYIVLSTNSNSANDIKIIGPQNSVLEGMELIFRDSGTGIGQTDIAITQGICDKLSNFLEQTLNIDNGSIQVAEKNLLTNNENNQHDKQAKEINIEQEREMLLNKYAQLQSTISSYNKQIESMKAWENARNAMNK